MASSSSPETNEELEALRRDKEYLKARLDFEIRQNKEEVDFLRTHCQKKLDFEREKAKENETAFEQRLLALRAEKDSQTQEFSKIIEQLETDKQQLQERVRRLEDGQLVPTRFMNDQQVQTSEVPGNLNSERRGQARHTEPAPSTGLLSELSSARQDAMQDASEGSTTLPSIEVCRQAVAHLRNPNISDSAFGAAPDVLYSRLLPLGFDCFPIESRSADVNFSDLDKLLKVVKSCCSRRRYKIYRLKSVYSTFKPTKPGAPGLFFSLGSPIHPQPELLCFIIHDGWNYLGNYEFQQADQLSANEFKRMPLDFQFNWRYELRKHPKHIARIFLHRELGRAPTGSEIQELLDDKSQYSKIEDIGLEERLEAFYDGIVKLNVQTMRCVGYDESLKHSILSKTSGESWSSDGEDTASISSAGDHPNASRRRLEEAASSDEEYQPPGKKARKARPVKGKGKARKN